MNGGGGGGGAAAGAAPSSGQVLAHAESLLEAVRRQAAAGAAWEAEVERLETKVQALTESKAALEREVKKERSARLELERAAETEKRARAALEEEKKTLLDRIAALKAGTRDQDTQQVLRLVSVRNQLLVQLNAAERRCSALEEQLKAAQEQLKTANDSSEAGRTIQELTQAKKTMAAAITALHEKHKALMAKHRSADGTLSPGGSSELSFQATDTPPTPEQPESRESDALRLTKFMDHTFACSGKKELLQAAFTAFFDEKPLEITSGGRYAPKPVLLIHQVELPQFGGRSAPAVIPPTASDPPSETEAAGNGHFAPPRHLEEEEKRYGGEGGGQTRGAVQGGQREEVPATPRQSKKPHPLASNEKTPPVAVAGASGLASQVAAAPVGSRDEAQPEERQQSVRKPLSRPTPRKRTRPSAAQKSRQSTPLLAGPSSPSASEQRRSTAGSEVDPALRVRIPAKQPQNCAIVAPPSQVGAGESIDVIDLRLLYETAPWETMFAMWPVISYTLDCTALSPSARSWVDMALAFRERFRWQLWEQQHWVVIPTSRTWAMDRMLEDRAIRQAQAQHAWVPVGRKAEELIQRGELDRAVWVEPFLWSWTAEPRPWFPRSHNLADELKALDAREPARCFYVHELGHHPFFVSGLVLRFRQAFRLPPRC